METTNTFLALLAGAALRIILPLGVTAVIIHFLRRLDSRWQLEAAQNLHVIKPECWKIKGCSKEKQASCIGAKSDKPCWQVFRKPDGYLRESCLNCDVLRKAPIPARV